MAANIEYGGLPSSTARWRTLGTAAEPPTRTWRPQVLYTIAVVLLILWLLGFFAFHVGTLIHLLLVIAIIVVLLRVIQGRRVV